METIGFEPTTPCLQSRCSSQLSYVPVERPTSVGEGTGLVASPGRGPATGLLKGLWRQPRARRAAGAVALTCAALSLMAGCRSEPGTAPGSAPAPAAVVPIASVADFCTNLDDLNSTAQQVGLDRGLAAVRSDLQRSAAKARQVLSSGVPRGSDVSSRLARLVSDLQDISAWLDTGATQSDLNADRVPAGVRESVDDMGYEFRQLQQWATANCNNQRQGDGQ